jgi:leucyl-tRNA synthetase
MIQAYAYKDERGALVPTDLVTERNDGTYVRTAGGDSLERIVAKMSKSLRNVVNTDEVISQYGADTLRVYEMFMGPLDLSKPWDTKAISGTYRFLRRSWTFVTGDLEEGHIATVSAAEEETEVVRSIHSATERVTKSLDSMKFNTAVSGLMEFLNEVSGRKVSLETLRKFVLLLSPLAPHMCEELWSRLGNTKSLAYEPWPSYDEALLITETITVVVQIKGKKRATVDVPREIPEASLKEVIIQRMAETAYKVTETNRFITVFEPGTSTPRLVNIV